LAKKKFLIPLSAFLLFVLTESLYCPEISIKGLFLSGKSTVESNFDLPMGKLPWPHQEPGLSSAEFDTLINGLWILDNFGTYHATDDGKYVYFHDGIDIMLENGTKLYAVESGYVKSLREEPSGGGHINIGDTQGDLPGYGWEYAHTGNFQFKEGDYVHQGDFIGEVFIREHVHLSRIRVLQGSWADKRDLEYLQPLDYFVFEDTLAPEIVSPFFYFLNDSDEPFINGFPIEVCGKVDIIVPMRDLAESNLRGSLNRWCVGWIEYEIKGDQNSVVHKKSFDFRKIIFAEWPGQMYDERVFAIYKPHYLPLLAGSGLDTRNVSFFIITNMEGTKECCEMYDIYQSQAWDTTVLTDDGLPLFPDGLYTITVRAYDMKGNCASASDVVGVKNTIFDF
jgi:hypothetical protein